jgi:hypothetical protein
MDRRSFLTRFVLLPPAAALSPALLRALSRFQDRSTGASNLSASIWIYLWDLVDEGYDAVFQRLGENGLTSISLATAYHAGKFLSPHNPVRKVVFLEDGTIYFRPNPALYGRIKPIVNSLVHEGHGLREALRNAERYGLQTRSWVVCCHNTPLGTLYPDVAVRDAFGDRLPHNLCPGNPDVRAYLRALVKDIAAHGVESIELEAVQFQGYPHGFHHEREGIVLSPAARFLLGLCFCDACLERSREAHVDLPAVQTFARKTLEEYFTSPTAAADRYSSVEALPRDLFEPFLSWRQSVVVSLVRELAEQTGSRGPKLRPMVSLDPAARTVVSMDPVAVANVTGGVLVPGYTREGSALRTSLAPLIAQLGGKELTVGFQVGFPESGGKTEFLDRVKTARGLGIHSFNFYNYGLVPLERLAWIKESLQG